MYKVKIIGAGSIGNHLAYACRSMGWNVLICDTDPQALIRTKEDIYPSRYGSWDKEIELMAMDATPNEKYDLVIIGTPPEYHIPIALDILDKNPPKVLHIEKPLCTPSLEGVNALIEKVKITDTYIVVGYNHTLTKNTKIAKKIISKGYIGKPLTITAMTREHWGGIFKAHPWLSGPEDTYLGFYNRGGGACGEHSHAINIWQYFANLLDVGRISEVSAMLDLIKDGKSEYDQLCLLNVKTEKGLTGNIIQDVITEPSQKLLRIQGEKGFLEWIVNYKRNKDAVKYTDANGEIIVEEIPKTRPDDFKGEIESIADILSGNNKEDSVISLERGLETMMVISSAFISSEKGKVVKIDYSKGFSTDSIITK